MYNHALHIYPMYTSMNIKLYILHNTNDPHSFHHINTYIIIACMILLSTDHYWLYIPYCQIISSQHVYHNRKSILNYRALRKQKPYHKHTALLSLGPSIMGISIYEIYPTFGSYFRTISSKIALSSPLNKTSQWIND